MRASKGPDATTDQETTATRERHGEARLPEFGNATDDVTTRC